MACTFGTGRYFIGTCLFFLFSFHLLGEGLVVYNLHEENVRK